MLNPFADPVAAPVRPRIDHYYGDIQRRLFFGIAIIMLLGVFIFGDSVRAPLILSLLTIIILVVTAGFISPKQRWFGVTNIIVALLGTLIFGREAFVAHIDARAGMIPVVLPWVDLLIAALFLITLYFSVKTARWRFTKGRERLMRSSVEDAQSTVSSDTTN